MDLGQLISWTAYICLAGATFGCLYMAVACLRVLRFGRAQTAGANQSPVPVTVLMPLCGDEPNLYERLRALAEQDYAAPVQVLCAIHDANDPSVAVVKKVAADLPQANIEWQVDPRLHGRNLKMSNLVNALERVRHDVLVMIDSDILVGRGYLAHVVGELQRPNVGAVTCLYYGLASDGLWTKLSAKSTNLHFLPSVIVGLSARLAQPCFGSTIALTRKTLEQIGGLQPFVDHLWDDYAIGQAVRAAGLQVAVSRSPSAMSARKAAGANSSITSCVTRAPSPASIPSAISVPSSPIHSRWRCPRCCSARASRRLRSPRSRSPAASRSAIACSGGSACARITGWCRYTISPLLRFTSHASSAAR